MKIYFSKNYKIIFVLWVATGIAVSGGFFIYSRSHPVYTADYELTLAYYEKEKHFEVSCLITIVGAVLIGGLGYASNSKN
jgi:hypothetical protein